MPINKSCTICKKQFKVYSYKPRDTCSPECRQKQAYLTDKARREKITARAAELSPLLHSLRVRINNVPGVPRRKCPLCERRVRLVSPIPGLTWLRSHYDQTGKECAGSRDIVCYPKEKEVCHED